MKTYFTQEFKALLSKSKNLKKAFNYDFLHRWLGLGLLTSTGEKWKKHRKIITPTFHFSILEQFVDVFNKQGNILMSILKKKEGEEPFDITPHIDLYTQDVICGKKKQPKIEHKNVFVETAMGVKLNAQTEGYASSYLQSVKSMCELLMQRSSKPWLYVDFIYRLTHLGWKERNNLKVLHGMTNEVIRRRKKQLQEDPTLFEKNLDEIGRKRKLAFLDLLLYSSLNGDVLSDEDIREEVDTFMFEGHDTTASAISFALYELSRRPDIQERILDELREVVPDDKLEELSLNLEDLNKLKYLEQVIKETLRLYPSVPVFGRQTTEDLHLPSMSVDVPPNTTVVVVSMLLHRNPKFYPNPEEFNPDNFLLETVSKRHPYAYVPFSAGSRNCIGQKFAMLEVKAVLAKIVWNYSLQLDPTFEMKFVPEITLKSENGVRLSVVRRIRT
ncbi:Probable cytochrome P450 4d14 [Gryllus bimaculatus]|nr:Probable cytochrome P450 4d14 [Gryllus bimaculatus]